MTSPWTRAGRSVELRLSRNLAGLIDSLRIESDMSNPSKQPFVSGEELEDLHCSPEAMLVAEKGSAHQNELQKNRK